MSRDRIVYSSQHGRTCPHCGRPVKQCVCRANPRSTPRESRDGIVRVKREIAGRRGKPVTTIHGVPGDDVALRDLEGREHKLADYKGKVIVLNFWATWCDPCREEMPAMQRLQDKLAGKPFVILAVDYGEGAPRIKDFLKNVPVRFTMLLDRDTAAATAWKVKVLPTSLVIDPQQKVRFVAVGDIGWDTAPVENEIMKLLPKP